MHATKYDSIPSDSGRQAPSEKHLEDYLWEHPEALGLATRDYGDGRDRGWLFDFFLRQYPLPSGRPDLIGRLHGNFLLVVELKKGPITFESLGQLLRYLRDIRDGFYHVYDEYIAAKAEDYEYLWNFGRNQTPIVNSMVRGMLIGSSIEDPNIQLAADGARILLCTYSYQDGEYQFSDSFHMKPQPLKNWLNDCPDLHDVIWNIMGINAGFHRQMIEYDQFNIVATAEEYLNDLDGAA